MLPPQVFGTQEEHKECHDPVGHHLMPSPLHYTLGITNHTHDVMKVRFPVLVALWVKIATAKESGNPKMRFKGPECIKLLENLNAFQDRYGNPKLLDLVPYLNFLKAYNEVRKTCYVKKVFDDEDLEQCNDALKKFKIAAKVVIDDFDIHAINKIHSVAIHVGKWINHFKIGLGFVIEQTGEAIHDDLHKYYTNKSLMADPKNDKYLDDLFAKTVAYVSAKSRRVPV